MVSAQRQKDLVTTANALSMFLDEVVNLVSAKEVFQQQTALVADFPLL